MADAHFFRHDFARADETVAAALALSETLDDPGLRVGAQATATSIAMAQGRTDEAGRRCDAVLALTGWQPNVASEEDPVVAGARLGTLGWVGLLRTMQGDSARATPAIEASLRLGQELHNPFLTGRSRFALAMSLGNQGRYDEALATLREALRLAEEAGDRYFLPRLLNTAGWVYSDLGDLRQAEDWNRRSIAAARETGWLEAEANARVNLGADALRRGDAAAAREELAQAAALVDRDGWFTWRYRLRLLVGLGELSLLEGNPDQALAFARDALVRAEATTSRKHAGRAWLLIGQATLAAGGPGEEALRQVERAHALARATGNPPLLWASGVELAGLRARLGREAETEVLQKQLRASVDAVVGSVQDAALRNSLSRSPLVEAIIAGAWAFRPNPGTIIPR
jgi:tetratricopeptide (TPR) repeat protein